MRISGFTIARQAVALGYPLEESLRSLLPLVDELIVGVGDAEDGTWELVQSIGDARIKAFRSAWDLSHDRGGEVLSEQTNRAMERCSGDWGFYLQADEVLHEDEIPAVRAAIERCHLSAVEGISLRYYHFFGSYEVIQDDPVAFYPRATRAVRLGAGVRSAGDACGFLHVDGDRTRRLRRADIGAHVYHYGWARPPEVMRRKQRNLQSFYGFAPRDDDDIFAARGNLRLFRGTHPAVMRARVAAQDWSFDPRLEEQPPEWLRRGMGYARFILDRLRQRARRLASGEP